MDHHISVIHQDPVSGLVSFHLLWFYSGSAQFFTDTVRHSLNLVPVGSAGDDKIICQSGNLLNINDLNVLCFFIFHSLTGKTHHFFTFHVFPFSAFFPGEEFHNIQKPSVSSDPAPYCCFLNKKGCLLKYSTCLHRDLQKPLSGSRTVWGLYFFPARYNQQYIQSFLIRSLLLSL